MKNNKEEGKVQQNKKKKEKMLFSAAYELFTTKGARMAKGTTTEQGLVTSFFANPFGPVQKQEETNKLIDEYFDVMFNDKDVKLGQIKTCLGVKGQEKTGPRNAAIELFEEIKKI